MDARTRQEIGKVLISKTPGCGEAIAVLRQAPTQIFSPTNPNEGDCRHIAWVCALCNPHCCTWLVCPSAPTTRALWQRDGFLRRLPSNPVRGFLGSNLATLACSVAVVTRNSATQQPRQPALSPTMLLPTRSGGRRTCETIRRSHCEVSFGDWSASTRIPSKRISNRNGTGSCKLIWRNCGCSGFRRKFRSPDVTDGTVSTTEL